MNKLCGKTKYIAKNFIGRAIVLVRCASIEETFPILKRINWLIKEGDSFDPQ